MLVHDQPLVMPANRPHGRNVHQHAMVFESLVVERRHAEFVRFGGGERDLAEWCLSKSILRSEPSLRRTNDPPAWWMIGGSVGPINVTGATAAEPFASAFSTIASNQPGQ